MKTPTDRQLLQERAVMRDSQEARDNANTTNGITFGFFLAALVGLMAALLLLGQRSNQSLPVIQPQAPDANINMPTQPPEVPQVVPSDNFTVPPAQPPEVPRTIPAPAPLQ